MGSFFLNIRENISKKRLLSNSKFQSCITFGLRSRRDLLLFKVIKEYLGYGNLLEEANKVVIFKV